MSNIRSIRVLNFIGKKEEWSTRSEKFLGKTRRTDIKDIPFGEVTISKTNEDINEEQMKGR
jgi:hypothetical protein